MQLSNLELGEVSRFEADNQIGLPTRRSGGIPLLKDLPILKDIPLIGYFMREGRRAAKSQESIVLAQTTVYPTVAEIVDLLLETPSQPENVNKEDQKYDSP